MTKKDYILVANTLRNILGNSYMITIKSKEEWINIVTMSLAEDFSIKNPKFDKHKFYNAVWSK